MAVAPAHRRLPAVRPRVGPARAQIAVRPRAPPDTPAARSRGMSANTHVECDFEEYNARALLLLDRSTQPGPETVRFAEERRVRSSSRDDASRGVRGVWAEWSCTEQCVFQIIRAPIPDRTCFRRAHLPGSGSRKREAVSRTKLSGNKLSGRDCSLRRARHRSRAQACRHKCAARSLRVAKKHVPHRDWTT